MTTTLTAPAVTLDETEAAEAEGIATMPSDLVALRERKLVLDAQKAVIEEELTAIRDTFGKRLLEAGLQGYTFGGKVHARRSEVLTNRIDTEKLKAKHPQIYRAFLKATTSVRVVIN